MKETRILHITDFHVNDISDSSNEHLREKYYQKYIDELTDAVKIDHKSIDAIIATGDFIDKGKIENYNHCVKIMERICKGLDLGKEGIGICIGNHDIACTFDEDGKLQPELDNRDKFNLFADNFGNKLTKLAGNKRYVLSKLRKNLFFLALDSTLGRTSDQPGKLSKYESSEILDVLKSHGVNHPDHILIIGSHYPMTNFDTFPAEDGWYDRHVWRSANKLKSEIQNFFDQCQILYLFGDTHLPDKEQRKNQVFVMSGRIGTRIFSGEPENLENYSALNREAKVIHYRKDNTVDIQTYFYHPESHIEDSHGGTWSCTSPIPIDYKIERAETIRSKNDKFFEAKIIDYIDDKDLYSFGRFRVTINDEEKISLGWVSINNLLADRNDILPELIVSARNWLIKKIDDFDSKQILFVGVDFWGSIIASQLGLMTFNRSFCKASRGSDSDYSISELFNDADSEYIAETIDYVIFLTDVVSSGVTLRRIYEFIMPNLGERDIGYLAISVISDRNQKKKADISFLSSFGTFCSNLRLPVVEKEDLPRESILPNREYFS